MRGVMVVALCMAVGPWCAIVRAQERLTQLSLTEAVSLAAQGNPTLRAKQFEYQSVADTEITAGLRPHPTANFLDEQFAGDSTGSQATYTVSVGQPIELCGKRQRRVESARAATRVTGYELDDVRRQIVFIVKKSFTDALVARDTLALAEDNLRTLDELERIQRV